MDWPYLDESELIWLGVLKTAIQYGTRSDWMDGTDHDMAMIGVPPTTRESCRQQLDQICADKGVRKPVYWW